MAIKTPMAYPPPSSGQSRHLAWSGHFVVATWLLYSYAVIAIKHAWVKDGRLHIVRVSHIRLSKKFKLRKARVARPTLSQSWTIRRTWCQWGEDAWCQRGEGKKSDGVLRQKCSSDCWVLCQCHDFYSDVPVVVEKLYVEQQMKIVNWGRMVCKKE